MSNAIKYRDRYIKRAARVLPAIELNVPFTPEAIDKIVGGPYSSKFIFYLRELGFQFDHQKDGRKIVSYTLTAEPDDADTIRIASPSKTRGKGTPAPAPKTTKVAKAPKTKSVSKALGLTMAEAKEIRDEVAAEKALIAKVKAPKKSASKGKKSIADIKAANLAKLKEVGAKFNSVSSYNVDTDWDDANLTGTDLKNLI